MHLPSSIRHLNAAEQPSIRARFTSRRPEHRAAAGSSPAAGGRQGPSELRRTAAVRGWTIHRRQQRQLCINRCPATCLGSATTQSAPHDSSRAGQPALAGRTLVFFSVCSLTCSSSSIRRGSDTCGQGNRPGTGQRNQLEACGQANRQPRERCTRCLGTQRLHSSALRRLDPCAAGSPPAAPPFPVSARAEPP